MHPRVKGTAQPRYRARILARSRNRALSQTPATPTTMPTGKRPAPTKATKAASDKSDSDSDSDDFGMQAAFAKSASKPVARQRTQGGGGGMARARAQGMVVEIKDETVNKRNGSGTIPKRRMTLVNPKVMGDGADNYVGSDFASFLLPMIEKDDGGSEDGHAGGGGDGQGKRKERVLTYPDSYNTRCRRIDGSMVVSLYRESFSKDKESDVGRMKVGDIIEVWSLEAVVDINRIGEETLFLNAGGGKIVTEGPPVSEVPRALMSYAMERQEQALFTASTAKSGFFDASELRTFNEEQTRQAKILQSQWKDHIEKIGQNFRNLSVGKDEQLTANLVDAADRLKEKGPEHFAAGGIICPYEEKYDLPVVPLILLGDSPAHQKQAKGLPVVLQQLKKAVKDDEVRSTLPKSMLAAVVSNLEFYKEGSNGFVLTITAVAVPDVDGAVEALKENKKANPGLQLGTSILVDQTLKSYQRESCRDKNFVKLFVEEVFTGQITGALFAKMGEAKESDTGWNVYSQWPIASGVKLMLDATLTKGGVLVSKEFVVENLCDGTSQCVGERTLEQENALPLSEDQEPVTFAKHGVQELSSGSWKLSHLDPDRFKDATAPMKTEFRVLFSGVRNLLADDDEPRTDPKAGEAAVAKMAKEAGKSVKEFVCWSTLLYAVAVPEA